MTQITARTTARPRPQPSMLNCALTALLMVSVTQSVASAAAQPANPSPYLGSNITRTYNVEDLMTRPGLLKIGKGDMIVLDFPAAVTAIITPQAAMLDIPEPIGNIAVLTGKVASGSAQMMVQLDNGKYATFQISFTAGGNGMKRIKVQDIPATDYAQPVADAPAAASAFPVISAPVTPAALPAPSQPAPSQPGAAGSGSLNVGTFPTQGAAALNRPQPAWLRLDSSVKSGGALTVTVSNSGVRPITLNTKDLYITDQGRSMPVTYDQDVTVNASASQTFIIPLPEQASISSGIKVDWLAFDTGANTYYALSNH